MPAGPLACGHPRVGLPRALLAYRYYPLWHRFLTALGCTVVTSPPTNKDILAAGIRATIDDVCIPLKAFVGHLLYLKALGVDRMMVPRVFAIENSPKRRFTCPKFMGLPDLARAVLEGSPLLLDADLDVRERPAEETFVETGRMLGCAKKAALASYRAAIDVQVRFDGLRAEGCGFSRALGLALAGDASDARADRQPEPSPCRPSACRDGEPAEAGAVMTDCRSPAPARCRAATNSGFRPGDRSGPSVAVVGHPYLLCDRFLSFSLYERLERLGVRVVDLFTVPRAAIENELANYAELSWSYERELLGAVSHFMTRRHVDGIVFLTSFACGTFPVVSEVIEREVRRRATRPVPVLYLMVDELTGEAGVQTRLESFCDMIG